MCANFIAYSKHPVSGCFLLMLCSRGTWPLASWLYYFLPGGADVNVCTGGTDFWGILRNAGPSLVQGTQNFQSALGRIQSWVYRAKKLTGQFLNPRLIFWANTQEVKELDRASGWDFQGKCQLAWYYQSGMEEARPNCFLPQQNTGYFVDYQAFAQVDWKQGSQRPLVECIGTF